MNKYIIIKVTNQINRFVKKSISHQINLLDINYIDDNNILVKIEVKDLKKIKRLNYYSEITIIKYLGTDAFKRHVKNNIYIYLIVLFSFLLMEIATNFIIKIDVIHENSKIRKLVKEELTLNGITLYSLAKDFDELEEIKNIILSNNRNTLEWLSITRVGMTYVIRIEERIITDIKKEEGYAHIIATKDALITKVISSRGEVKVRSGDYVKRGETLISGSISLYDSVKGNVLSRGEVYGEVWYNVDISYPTSKTEKKYTDNKRYNLMINNKPVFKNKYQYFTQDKMKKLKIFNFTFSFYQEREYELITTNYTDEEILNLALKKSEEEFLVKLNGKGTVLSQKVLKKEQNNSTMSIRVFVITNELISKIKYYDIGSDIIDTESSN